jgi:hypothetical protein
MERHTLGTNCHLFLASTLCPLTFALHLYYLWTDTNEAIQQELLLYDTRPSESN